MQPSSTTQVLTGRSHQTAGKAEGPSPTALPIIQFFDTLVQHSDQDSGTAIPYSDQFKLYQCCKQCLGKTDADNSDLSDEGVVTKGAECLFDLALHLHIFVGSKYSSAMVVAIEASVYESHVVNNPELEWYRLSSVARHPIFQVLLQSDFDFAQDYVRFIDCIKTGAESGRKVAQFFMGIVCLDQAAKESDPARISEALKCAYDYLLNSSAQNYPPANYILERIPSSTDCRNVNVVKLLKEVDTPSVRDVFDSDLMIEPNKGSPNGPPAITSTGRAGGCIII